MLYFASDHAGFELKNKLVNSFRELGYSVEDCGAHEYNEQDDYPEFIRRAAQKVSSDPENSKAVILGGSGQGEAMVANRFRGVRAAVYYGGNTDIITLSREHNNANVLSLGARFIEHSMATEVAKLWLQTNFTGEERHVRRIGQIDAS